MLSSKSLAIVSGGLTKDPEVFESAGVVHLSIAVDNAGSEKGVQFAPGYFDVKVWMNESKYSPPALAEYIKKNLKEGTLRKGSRVSVVGQLKQERWKTNEGGRGAKVIIIAESIDIYTSAAVSTTTRNANTGIAASVNDSYTSDESDSDSDMVPEF